MGASLFFVPRVKFVLRGVLEVTFLALLSYVLLFVPHNQVPHQQASNPARAIADAFLQKISPGRCVRASGSLWAQLHLSEVLLVAWACGLTFVSLQVTGRHCHRHSTPPLLPPPPPPPHLLHHPSVQGYLAFCVNHSYVIALLSYGSEVGGTILAFLLPALAGIHHMCRKGKKNDVAGRIEREKLIKPEDDTSSSDDEPPPRIDPNRASLV